MITVIGDWGGRKKGVIQLETMPGDDIVGRINLRRHLIGKLKKSTNSSATDQYEANYWREKKTAPKNGTQGQIMNDISLPRNIPNNSAMAKWWKLCTDSSPKES